MIFINEFVAPISSPQVFNPLLAGVQHPLGPAVMNAMRKRGTIPINLWKLINSLADARQPDSRDQRRFLRLRFLGALRELLKTGMLHRRGPLISLVEIAAKPRLRSRDRGRWLPSTGDPGLMPSVGILMAETGGSNLTASKAETASNLKQLPQRQVVAQSPGTTCDVAVSESAGPTVAEISAAASALARRPRKMKRPWTGYLEGERIKRGTLVQLPSREVLSVYAVTRGKVLVALPDEPCYADRVFDRYDANQVRRVKLPEAQILGSLKKGVIEVKSESKARAARLNARMPPRAGRKRG